MAGRLIAEKLHYHVADRTVIDNALFALRKGELVMLISLNGVGKSTLLRSLTGFLKPATGRCVLSDEPPEEQPIQKLSRHRAVTCQQAQLGFDWPIEAAVAMECAPQGQRPEPGLIAQVTGMTGYTPLTGRQYAVLSGGGRQRVQLTCALVRFWCGGASRGWLFLDGPTFALDLHHQQHLLRMLETLATSGGLHVCIVFHGLNLAALWVDRIVLLHNDRLVSQGTLGTVLQADGLKRWYGTQVHVGQHSAGTFPRVFLAP